MVSFSFIHPQYLFLFFAIPLLFFIHFFALNYKRKIALKFANEGANVAFSDIKYDDDAKSLEAEIEKLRWISKGYDDVIIKTINKYE